MKASELMTPSPVTCHTTDSLERAAQIMCEQDLGWVPVIGEDGQVCGVITDRDICMAAYSCGTALRHIPVGGAMSCDVETASPDDEIGDIEARMRERQVRRIPVVDASSHPVGVVSIADIARAYHQAHLAAADVARTLAAVGEPGHDAAPIL